MIKYIILGSIVSVFVINNLFKQDVSLQIKVPETAEAGSTFDVEIELYKSDLTGFARFRQELPYGVTASPVYPAEMNFSFEDNNVTMIWLNLPREEIINIRYQIHISERLKGDMQLDGNFSYIKDNQRRTAGAQTMTVAINPSPRIEESLIVDVSEAGQKLLSPLRLPDHTGNIIAIRQEPVPDNDLGYIVNILINKEDKSHFAKIEEQIPEGYTAIEMVNRGGIFSFSDQKARIIWKNLPMERNFLVSYRIIPDEEREILPAISGEFSYMHNEITASRRIIQTSRDLISLNEKEKQQLLVSLSGEAAIPSPDEELTVRPLPAPVTTERMPVIKPGFEPARPIRAESGVYYRVQLAAGRRPVNIESYFSRFNIAGDVRSEIHEGWIKYTIGSYYDYKSARDSRVNIWQTTPIYDAFVSAYNDGRRITVQEALMIANHQWYR